MFPSTLRPRVFNPPRTVLESLRTVSDAFLTNVQMFIGIVLGCHISWVERCILWKGVVIVFWVWEVFLDVLYGFFSYCVIVVVDYCDFFDVV